MSELSYEDVADIERAEGFDRAAAETAINEALERHGMLGGNFFECRNPGVLAIERIDGSQRLQQAMNEVAEEMGIAITCVANCDWVLDQADYGDDDLEEDACDEEATWIAFDIPSLPPSYGSAIGRNRIFPTGSDMAVRSAEEAEAAISARRP